MDRTLRPFLIALLSLLCGLARAQLSTNSHPVQVPANSSVSAWPQVTAFLAEPGCPAIRSKDLEIIHSKSALGGFRIQVGGDLMAIGTAPLRIGYVREGSLRWLNCSQETASKQNLTFAGNDVLAAFECTDPDGGSWSVTRRFRILPGADAIEVQTEIKLSQDRAIAFLPIMMLFPGAGSFGVAKNQGLFAGLEYLENEPSSSEADVIGPASKRQVPDSEKITCPLMVIQAAHHYVGLTWQMRPYLSAVFDSPDRLFNSGGHVMGLLFPGSNGNDREEGNLLPRVTELVRAGNTITSRATIFGGAGESVVPAIQHFCRLRPMPDLPPAPELSAYVSQSAGGWLDSKIREGNQFHHALAGGGFPLQPAADAALWMEWLAQRESNSDIAIRLQETASNVLSVIPPDNLNFAGVGHIRYPVESLVFGHVPENAEHAGQVRHALLSSFELDGSARYYPKPGGPDLSKTYFTNEASGFASRRVADLLESALFSGERALLNSALDHLRSLDRFHNGVPRGAQTWECPLHTPDILAAAQMVKAYTSGYQLTGDPHFLEEARYWAWTGIPFVYLVNPTEKPIGLYSTIAVFGATQWRAPVWFGLPVQWCGLVYADALYSLEKADPQPIWKRVADGITISGMQQSWPIEDPQFQGLLPDSFVLRDQKRNGPAINPATVEACAAKFFGPVPPYDFCSFRGNHLLVHAPGKIENPHETSSQVNFEVQTWVNHPYFVLINGFTRSPRVKINGQATSNSSSQQFQEKDGRLILKLQGRALVVVDL